MRHFEEEADTTEVQIPVGDVFQISLSENPTAGYRWNLESRGEPVCSLVKEHFSPQGNAPGSAGIHHWNFSAMAPGTSTISLTYGRRWQEGPPARTFKLRIRAGE
jgi:inhibitor of cysteine peptidase